MHQTIKTPYARTQKQNMFTVSSDPESSTNPGYATNDATNDTTNDPTEVIECYDDASHTSRIPSSHQELSLRRHVPHPRFAEARERAYELNCELDQANKEYKRELVNILNNLRRSFLQKYHKELTELDELTDGIHSIQSKGLKALKQDLMQLQLSDASYEEMREQSRVLSKRYRETYYPNDNYQKRCDLEAMQLRQCIMPMLGGGLLQN